MSPIFFFSSKKKRTSHSVGSYKRDGSKIFDTASGSLSLIFDANAAMFLLELIDQVVAAFFHSLTRHSRGWFSRSA